MMANLRAFGCSSTGLYGRFLWVNTNGNGISTQEGISGNMECVGESIS